MIAGVADPERISALWPTIAVSLSIIGSALGIMLTIWKVILSTVNGHLKEFGTRLMERINAGNAKTAESNDEIRVAVVGALNTDGERTRQTLRDLLPRRR